MDSKHGGRTFIKGLISGSFITAAVALFGGGVGFLVSRAASCPRRRHRGEFF